MDAVRAALDPAYFSREHSAWEPYPYQQDVLDAVLLHGKRRIAWIAGRRVGKPEGVANLVLQLAVKRKGIDIVIFAPSLRQARVLSRKIRYMLAGSSWEGHRTVDNVGELRLSFGTDEDGKPVESTIYTMSLSGKARGEGADVLVIDESAFCDGEDYRNKALPFVVDRAGEVIVHISTVWSEDDHFMKAYERYQELEHGATFRTATRDKPGVSEAILEEFRAEMLESEFMREYECKLVPNRLEPFRFTGASRDFLVDNARYLVEEGLVELPVEPESVRRAFLNVESTRKGYEIPSRELKDIFDGIALALSEVKSGRRRAGMDVMTAKYQGSPGRGLGSGFGHGLR